MAQRAPRGPRIWQFGARAARARIAEMRRPKARAGVWLATGGGAHQQRAAAVHSNCFIMAPSVTTRLRLPTPPQLLQRISVRHVRSCPGPGANAVFVARASNPDEFPDEFPDSLGAWARGPGTARRGTTWGRARCSAPHNDPQILQYCARAACAHSGNAAPQGARGHMAGAPKPAAPADLKGACARPMIRSSGLSAEVVGSLLSARIPQEHCNSGLLPDG